MKNLKSIMAALLIMSVCLTGCGASGASSNNGIPNQEEIDAATALLGDNITNMDLSINGQVYQFPMELQDLLDNGWKLNVKSETIPAFSVTTAIGARKNKEGASISFTLENNSASEKDMEALPLDSLTLERDDNVTLILPKGLTWESTAEDVIEAYDLTKDDLIEEGEFLCMYLSSSDTYVQVRIDYDVQTRTIKKITYSTRI